MQKAKHDSAGFVGICNNLLINRDVGNHKSHTQEGHQIISVGPDVGPRYVMLSFARQGFDVANNKRRFLFVII